MNSDSSAQSSGFREFSSSFCAKHGWFDGHGSQCPFCTVPASPKVTIQVNTHSSSDLSDLGQGKKFDDGKPRMELLSRAALEKIATVMTHGAKKYEEDNWRKGLEWRRVLGAAFRHLLAFNDGEDKDPETGMSHLAHCGCCIMFLLEYEETHKELDNRYKKGEKK